MLFSLLHLAFPSAWLLAQDGGDTGLPVDDLLMRHESHAARIESISTNWEVDTGTGKPEAFQTIAGPSFERTLTQEASVSHRVMWNGDLQDTMRGFDPKATNDMHSMMAVRAHRFRSDVPINHMFHWRSLQLYRLLTIDNDQSVRDLVKSSATPVEVNRQGELYQIITMQDGPVVPGGGKMCDSCQVIIYLDAQAGFSVKRFVTRCIKPADTLIQTIEAVEVMEFVRNVFFPSVVKLNIKATSGGGEINHEIKFKEVVVNGDVDFAETIFVENIVVREMEHLEADRPSQYFVTGKNGELGDPYQDEMEALAELASRFGGGPRVKVSRFRWVWFLATGILLATIVVLLTWRRGLGR